MATKKKSTRKLSKRELGNLKVGREKAIVAARETLTKNKKEEYKEQAEIWREFINIGERIAQLDDLAFRYLLGKVTLSRDQVAMMKQLIVTYSDKLIPAAKPTSVTPEGKRVIIGLPKDLK